MAHKISAKLGILSGVTFAIIVLLIGTGLVSIPFLDLNSTSYVSGFQAPTATFTSLMGISAGSGTYNFKGYDNGNWNMRYNIGGTSATLQPYNPQGHACSALDISMGGISFPNGVATQPEKTYTWTINNADGSKDDYTMALYPLTWSIDFRTSTTSFQDIFDYLSVPLNMKIDLNSKMWYFENQPTNVYFGIAAISLQNYQLVSTPAKVPDTWPLPLLKSTDAQAQINPSDLGDLLQITSPTNTETGANAFYSYKDTALNPQLFAPSVTTSVLITNLAPSQYETWTGVFSGGDVNVHLVFKVDTIVVGDWKVQPTYQGTTTPVIPGVNLPFVLTIGQLFLIIFVATVIIIVAYIIYKVRKK